MAATRPDLPPSSGTAAGATASSDTTMPSAVVAALIADGLLCPQEPLEELKEHFLLLDFDPEKSIASALAAHRLLREFARRGRSSSSNSSSNSNSSRRGNSNSSSSSLRLSVGVGEEFTVAGEVACSRLGTARRQQQRLQQLLQADAETLQQTLQTKRDWEALAGSFPYNFFALCRAFLLAEGGTSVRRPSATHSNIEGTSDRSSASMWGDIWKPGDGCCLPVNLTAVQKLHSAIVAAARAVRSDSSNSDWDPVELLLQMIYGLCCRLLQRAAALHQPQQLAFIPVLLEGRLLEESADFSELAKICEVVAELPYTARRTIARWYLDVPVRHLEQHITVVQQLITVRVLSAGPLENWHYLQAPQHPAETALRAALLLLHILYVANVHRQQRRLQTCDGDPHLDAPTLLRSAIHSPAAPEEAVVAGGAAGALAEAAPEVNARSGERVASQTTVEYQQHHQGQEDLSEIDFNFFHNDAINSSHQLLQHEFALWLRLRRGAAAPAVSSLLLQQALQQQQQRERRDRSRQHSILTIAPHSAFVAHSMETSAATAATQERAATAPGPAGNGCSQVAAPATRNGSEIPSTNGVLSAAPLAPPQESTEGADEGGPVTAEDTMVLRSVSVHSLFSAEDDSGSGLLSPGLLTADSEAPVAAGAGPSAPAITQAVAESGFAAEIGAFVSEGMATGFNTPNDRSSNHLMLGRSVRTSAESGAVASNMIGFLPLPLGVWSSASAAAALAAGAASPAAVLSSPAAAAAAAAANRPFNHFAVPQANLHTHEFSLLAHPFVLDASAKAEIIRMQATLEQQHQARQAEVEALLALCRGGVGSPLPFLYLQVRRTHLVEDTLQQIASSSTNSSTDFRKALKVQFVGEEGVDQGGVTKEFFQLLVDELFNPAYGMFTVDEESSSCWFSSNMMAGVVPFELIGIICGLAIHNAVLMPVNFPLLLFKKLLEWPANTLQDLFSLHPQVARCLAYVLEASAEELDEMALTFSYTSNVFGEYRDVALGTHSPTEVVSINNRTEYVEAYIHHVLSAAPASQFAAFKRGFFRCLDSNTLSLLLPQELQLLLLGSQQEISLAVLQKATRYQDGYSEDSLAIRRLWAILSNFTDKQKRQFLMFVTGSDRLPVGGAQALRLTIGRHGFDTDRLPTSHTCFNFLLLPDYSSQEKMQRLLLIAIQNCRGFGLR